MKTFVVLFRGINVGGKNRLPMKQLAATLEKNGYQDIETYIQSGNVVLKSRTRPDAKIRTLVQDEFGFNPDIIAIEAATFHTVIKNNPYSTDDGKKLHFYFCKSSPKPDADKLEKLKSQSEEYCMKGKCFYLYAPDGIGRSKLVANIDACLGVPATGRNFNTIGKLQQILHDRKP